MFVEFVPSGVGEAVFERVDFVLVVGVPFGAGDGFELVDGYGVVGDGDLDCVFVEGDVCFSDWLVGQMMRAGYWFVCSVVARAWSDLPRPISSAMKVRCFSVA